MTIGTRLDSLLAGGIVAAANGLGRILDLWGGRVEDRARTYLTTLDPTVCNGYSPDDIVGLMREDDVEPYFIPRVRNGRLITDADAFRSGGQTYETGPRPTLTVPPTPAPPAVEEPTGAGQSPSGTGEAHPERGTSDLFIALANQLVRVRFGDPNEYERELITEARDRAAYFEAEGD